MTQQTTTKQRIKRIRLEDALNANVWDVDAKPHIIVDSEKCVGCANNVCTYLCPGGCFTLLAGRILYSYEGCVECGTCRVVCPKDAITWNYPLSGRGIQYRFG